MGGGWQHGCWRSGGGCIGTQTDTSTNDFDLGVKSQSSGNREIITVTDVVTGAANTPAAGELQLENLFSDKFDIADADGLTYKLRQSVALASSGTRTQNIDTTVNDAFYQSVGGDAAGAVNTSITQNLTGDFSIQVKLNITNFPASNTGWALFTCLYDNDNVMTIYRVKDGASNQLIFVRVIGGVTTQDVLTPCTDDTVSFRLRRVGTTLYGAYDLNQGETWTEWTKTGGFTGDVEVILRFLSSANIGVRDGNWQDFKINSGTFASGGYRTAGNFVSRVVDCLAANQKVTDVVLTVNCPSAATTLKNGATDALEIYENDVNDIATATKLDGWTNAELLTAGMTEAGVNSTITLSGLALGTKRYKWYKVFGIGSGTATFRVFDVTTTYASGQSYIKFDGTVWTDATLVKTKVDGGVFS